MPLHILKLCVGRDTIADLEAEIAARLAMLRIAKQPVEQVHTTRMVPKRVDEILDGGSLYWVIKGQVAARQRILGIRPFTDGGGVGRCHIVLEPIVAPVIPRPCRPFQGWRYLDDATKPRDIDRVAGAAEMPEALRHALSELCLL